MARADDRPVRDVESVKEGRGTVALVVVGVGGGSSLLEWQAGLSPVQSLNLAFLIAAQHQCVFWSIEVKAHDVLELAHEVRIVGDLE